MKTFLEKKRLLFILLFCLSGCVPPLEGQKDITAAAAGSSADVAAYHYSLSVHLSLNGKHDEAIGELEKALSLDAKSSFLATELATLYSENGDIEKAISLCVKTLAENADDIDAHLLLAGLYLNKKDYPQSLREYKKVGELDPQRTDSPLYAGIIYGEAGNYEEALSSFNKLLAIDPDNLMGNYYLAGTFTKMKRYGEAEEKYKKVLAIRPLFEQAVIDLSRLYEIQANYTLALETYRNFIIINPHSVNVRLKMANLLLRLKKTEEAEKELQETLNQGKENREVIYTLGLFYLEKKQYDKAVEIFTELVKSAPDDHRLRYLLGSAYEEKKDYLKAIAELQKIPAEADIYPNAQIGISMIMKNNGRIDEAIAGLVTALHVRKDTPDFYVALSSLYEEKNDLLKAEETLKTGLQASPSVQLHYSLGVLYEKTDRFEESIREMEKVLKLDDKNADALNFIGYTYADRGIHLQEAEKLIKQALELKPGNGYMLDSLGWVYFRQKKVEQAIKYLKEAAAALPGDPNIAEHLGDVYAESGQLKEAIDNYGQALKLNPENKVLQQKIDKLTTDRKE
jgi:tetratricopeptide (TPR) repeat protein